MHKYSIKIETEEGVMVQNNICNSNKEIITLLTKFISQNSRHLKLYSMKKIALFLAINSVIFSATAQQINPKYQAYIDKHTEFAILEQERHAIPASITMAQALLESNAGESRLATIGNNHFGIKCGSDWTGESMYHDDDQLSECFRKYKQTVESFEDHSLFLKRQRYAFLFDYGINDYKSWAKGLSQAGYATDPSYPEKLIRIIETYNLANLDKKAGKSGIDEKDITKDNKTENNSETDTYKTTDYTRLWGYIEIQNNGVRCIRVITKDKISNVAKAFKISEKTLLYYNDLMPNMKELAAGDYVYLWQKRNKADKRYTTHTIEGGESMHSISQLYGIKLKKLYKLNNMEYGTPAEAGKVLRLQKQ